MSMFTLMHQTDAVVYELGWVTMILLLLLIVYSCIALTSTYDYPDYTPCAPSMPIPHVHHFHHNVHDRNGMGAQCGTSAWGSEEEVAAPGNPATRSIDVSQFFKKC